MSTRTYVLLGCLIAFACVANPAAAQWRLTASLEEQLNTPPISQNLIRRASHGADGRVPVQPVSHCATSGSCAVASCDAGPEPSCGCGSLSCDYGCDSMHGCDSLNGSCKSKGATTLLGLTRPGSCSQPCFFNSWIASGFSGNPDNPTNGSNLPVTFNDRANEYLMNQLYFSMGRDAQRSGAANIGGRVDFFYGSDYFFTQSLGLETNNDGSARWNSSSGPRGSGGALYGISLPQLYAEIYAPIGPGVTVKAGHFYTIIGYESVMAPQNFFYSHSYSMQYGQPFTHTGVLATIGGGDTELYAGVTQGWDTWSTGAIGFLGGFSVASGDSTLTFALSSGDEDSLGGPNPQRDNRTAFTTVYERSLNCNTKYAFEQVFGVQGNAVVNGTETESGHWYGINQYLFKELNNSTQLGLRVEWFRDEDNLRVLGIPIKSQTNGGNYVGITGGFNYRPTNWLNVRPEIRYDWSDAQTPILGQTGMFNDFTEDNQLTLSFDAIIQL